MRLLTFIVGICCSAALYTSSYSNSYANSDRDKEFYKSVSKSSSSNYNPYKYSPSNSNELKTAEYSLHNMCKDFDKINLQNKFLPTPEHKALYELHQRAVKNDPTAQAKIADYYIDGQHVPKDWKMSVCWYKAAAQNGSAYAEYWLGIFYQNGWVVKKSATVAAHWFSLAGQHHNSVAAETAVAARYADDNSGVHDLGRALFWYERAANKHDVNAELALGEFYMTSHDPADVKRALSWYGKAAAQNSIEAQYNIGQIYYRGEGIKQDYVQAHKWLLKAAERGYHPAQYDLAVMHYQGMGVSKDWIKSYAWLEVSKAADNNTAAKELEDMLVTHFTPEQLKQASNLSREYRARYAR